MVILEKNTVAEVISVIIATSDLYGILFKNAHIGSGLSCVEKLGFGSIQKIGNVASVCSDTAHSLQIVESRSFAGKKHSDISAN